MAEQKKGGASPYATGGGGVMLERAYGATLLSAVLLGAPVSGLGDEMRAVRVDLQAGPSSPVDDFVVHGENRSSGSRRRLSVGVRRDPTIAPSDTKFVKLLTDYLRIVIEAAADVNAGGWRLALAVAGPHTGAMETKTLADLARHHATSESFRETVARDRATTAQVRARLDLLDRAVEAAVICAGLGPRAGDLGVLTWRFLCALRVLLVRLEGDDATDRTHAVERLQTVVERPDDADHLFRALSDLVARFAPSAAVVDESVIRRELHGVVALRPSLVPQLQSYSRDRDAYLSLLLRSLDGRTVTAGLFPGAPSVSSVWVPSVVEPSWAADPAVEPGDRPLRPDLATAVNQFGGRHLLLGPVGSGKTEWLAHLAAQLARRALEDRLMPLLTDPLEKVCFA